MKLCFLVVYLLFAQEEVPASRVGLPGEVPRYTHKETHTFYLKLYYIAVSDTDLAGYPATINNFAGYLNRILFL